MSTDTQTQPITTDDTWEMEAKVGGPGGGDFELCPPGNYPANIVGLFDVGLHDREGDNGTYEARDLVIVLESQKKTFKGEHFFFSKMFTWSMKDNSNWYKLVSCLTGKKFQDGEKFNPKSVLGIPCMVNVTNAEVEKKGKKKTYHNIEAITQWPEGFDYPTNFRPPVVWSIRDKTPRPDCSWVPPVYGKDIAKLVSESKEYAAGQGTAVAMAEVRHIDPDPAQAAKDAIAEAAGIAF